MCKSDAKLISFHHCISFCEVSLKLRLLLFSFPHKSTTKHQSHMQHSNKRARDEEEASTSSMTVVCDEFDTNTQECDSQIETTTHNQQINLHLPPELWLVKVVPHLGCASDVVGMFGIDSQMRDIQRNHLKQSDLVHFANRVIQDGVSRDRLVKIDCRKGGDVMEVANKAYLPLVVLDNEEINVFAWSDDKIDAVNRVACLILRNWKGGDVTGLE